MDLMSKARQNFGLNGCGAKITFTATQPERLMQKSVSANSRNAKHVNKHQDRLSRSGAHMSSGIRVLECGCL